MSEVHILFIGKSQGTQELPPVAAHSHLQFDSWV